MKKNPNLCLVKKEREEKIMKYIKITGIEYACIDVLITQNAIEFTPNELKIEHAIEAFSEVKELTVLDENKETIGVYSGLEFKSATIDAEKNVKVVLSMETDTEKRLRTLEKGQAECEEAIAELIGGGVNE